ncbi:hypothetical protein DID88_007827 [Monilinia fructigena]|uniref:Uncharacterized protein n=1 Tax=Monilinia fructigena TaxID=38457 RepID=A0A395J3E6_9HELO|nr:hypothetical protein DID88_007827 [Monilinia fructigena]
MLNTGSSINWEEMILEDRGVNVRNIKNLIRDGPEATKWINYLKAQKQNLRNIAVESSMDSSMKQHMTSATHVADNQKRYLILVMPQIKNIYKNHARSDYRISAVPWYLANEIETERELSTPLGNGFVAGDGLERQRHSFLEDPLGKKSTLRMELFVGHGFDAEYRKQTDYGSVASIKSSMFNVVPSRLLPVRRDKPQKDEWENMNRILSN